MNGLASPVPVLDIVTVTGVCCYLLWIVLVFVCLILLGLVGVVTVVSCVIWLLFSLVSVICVVLSVIIFRVCVPVVVGFQLNVMGVLVPAC